MISLVYVLLIQVGDNNPYGVDASVVVIACNKITVKYDSDKVEKKLIIGIVTIMLKLLKTAIAKMLMLNSRLKQVINLENAVNKKRLTVLFICYIIKYE